MGWVQQHGGAFRRCENVANGSGLSVRRAGGGGERGEGARTFIGVIRVHRRGLNCDGGDRHQVVSVLVGSGIVRG